MNSYVCSGNLTRDPEIFEFNSGTKVVKFGLAVNGRFIKKDGETVKDDNGRPMREVTYWDCEAWGTQADTLKQYAEKGKPLIVHGEVKDETWEDKNSGQKRSKKILRVDKFDFVGSSSPSSSANDNETQDRPAPSAGKGKGRPKKEKARVEPDANDVEINDVNEIPF